LNRPELSFLKAKDGEPVFGEPWHAREHPWERAYLRTPHGKPVDLAAGMEPD
jgi:hypothetical protein